MPTWEQHPHKTRSEARSVQDESESSTTGVQDRMTRVSKKAMRRPIAKGGDR